MFGNIYKGKKVLITGDTGFKGSWLAIWLTQLGAEVYGYALAPAGKLDNFVVCGVGNIIKHKDGDVRNAEDLRIFFEEVQPQIVFHMAAQSLVLKSYEIPSETFSTNLIGVVNFFEAVRQTPSVKVAVNITSDKCYENQEWLWGYRESDRMGGKDPYSASKACAELITNSYSHSFFNTDTTCRIASARAGNVIGGGDWAENRIIPDFFRSIMTDSVLQVRNPYSIRPWQHVLEPLSGYLCLAASLYDDSIFAGAWNFGPSNDNNHTVRELIEQMTLSTKSAKSEFHTDTAGLHEAKLLHLDVSKANQLLKWRSVLSFEETLNYTAAGYLDQLNNKDLLLSRRQQINAYCEKARSVSLPYAKV